MKDKRAVQRSSQSSVACGNITHRTPVITPAYCVIVHSGPAGQYAVLTDGLRSMVMDAEECEKAGKQLLEAAERMRQHGAAER